MSTEIVPTPPTPPTAERHRPDRITVRMCDYAGIQPYAPVILGAPVPDGGVGDQEGTVVFEVEPDTDYAVFAMSRDTSPPPHLNPVRERFDFTLPVTREHRLDTIVMARIAYEQALNDFGADNFEIQASRQRVLAWIAEAKNELGGVPA